ncbi:hypothetical protein PLICRDRAFT_695143 [Plicaturopsis crispa FD-325 SS-3]|nr:hypothetical protein PLICRDRAFT_695143 [Plicaturopsis crispa FD-325 SS-3]
MSTSAEDKKGHLCPPSRATHPSDRWESLFVYGFICKFTRLRGKIEGLETPVDFENALLSREPNPILTQILGRFVVNLRPQTRNLSTDQISATVAAVMSDYFKTSERTVFWDENLNRNVDPFDGLDGGFFATDWDFKLKILRILVELQLCHTPDVKNTIDQAWGVIHNKHKKKETASTQPDPNDPHSRENLQLVPIGQDSHRKRYWVIDDSPRIYTSTNPWKVTATFQTVASTRDEYMATIEKLKSTAAPPPPDGRKTKMENHHDALIKALEDRIEMIDAGIARINKARRKIEQRQLLLAQAELRETRTRRQTRRPDYVYQQYQDPDSEDEGDEYAYQEQEDDEFDDPMEDDEFVNSRSNGSRGGRASSSRQRRSTRQSTGRTNGKQPAVDPMLQWRGERRSTRLGAPPDPLDDLLETGRARTEESTSSFGRKSSSVGPSNGDVPNGHTAKSHSAAAIKPTEIALEQVKGKKKSKYWFYAVEPIPGAPLPATDAPPNGTAIANGQHGNGNGNAGGHGKEDDSMDVDVHSEGSLSPPPSADS